MARTRIEVNDDLASVRKAIRSAEAAQSYESGLGLLLFLVFILFHLSLVLCKYMLTYSLLKIRCKEKTTLI
jgi:hypothetical protein